MKALVLGNGEPPSAELFLQEKAGAELLVCADGAADWLQSFGVQPDVLIGDMDSISAGRLAALHELGVSAVRFPSEKDDTDMLLAAEHARSLGADEIVLLGATGARLDHTLGNLQVLSHLHQKGVNARICDAYCTVSVVSGPLKIKAAPGGVFSIVPLERSVEIIELSGVKYPLDHYTMAFERPIGISNVFTANEATLDVSGRVALILVKRT